MMCTLGKFLNDRRLELNAEKSKVLIGEGMKGRKDENGGNKEIEEVQSFKYQGFMFNRKGNHKDQRS